ncbi:MAG: hypothetical protein ACK42Z_08960, partial [Candidatus Kapaibacteriota bacterium]
MHKSFFYAYILIFILLISCSKPKIVRELPVGNLTKVSAKNPPNTNIDDVAPIQQPNNLALIDPCEKEENFIASGIFDGIMTSSEFIKKT